MDDFLKISGMTSKLDIRIFVHKLVQKFVCNASTSNYACSTHFVALYSKCLNVVKGLLPEDMIVS